MLYVLKIKGTETIPDFVQIRDKDLTLLAYFRLSQIEKGLKKSNLEKDLEGLSLLIKKIKGAYNEASKIHNNRISDVFMLTDSWIKFRRRI